MLLIPEVRNEKLETFKFIISRLARDKTSLVGAILILGLIIVAIAAPVFAPYPEDVTEFHPAERLLGPSAQPLAQIEWVVFHGCCLEKYDNRYCHWCFCNHWGANRTVGWLFWNSFDALMGFRYFLAVLQIILIAIVNIGCVY